MARILFTGGHVFDGTGADPAAADVVIDGGRIVDVGPGLDADEAVDVRGKTLLPGFFDCHVHVMWTNTDLLAGLQTPFSYHFYEAARNLRKTLDVGITTVRDAGGADLGVKQAVDDGLIAGPRMQISLIMLSQTGGHGDAWMACGSHVRIFSQVHPGRPSGVVDGADEMRRKVRELVRMGADVIKVATSGGVLSPRDDPKHGHFRDEELAVLVEEATAAGRFVMAHAQAAEGIKAAIRTGIRSIEHGIYLDDEAIEMMLERGTYLVPTLSAPRGLLDAADRGLAVPEYALRKCRDVIDVHTDSITRAIAAGVKVAMGTDAAVCPHGDNLRELALMAAAGMAPARVLAATTSVAAELLGVADDLGTLAPGKRADIVVLDGDPFDFDDMRKRVTGVWKDGVPVAGADGPEGTAD